MTKYPVGGPREPVYQLMRNLGFSVVKWTDKVWTSADGLEVSIYGAGSRARVSRNNKPEGECMLDDLADHIALIRAPTTHCAHGTPLEEICNQCAPGHTV